MTKCSILRDVIYECSLTIEHKYRGRGISAPGAVLHYVNLLVTNMLVKPADLPKTVNVLDGLERC